MKNGFTLIELLAVIIIVSVLSTIAFVTVDKAVKDGKNSLYQVQVSTIYDGANAWAVDNISFLNEQLNDKEFHCIKLQVLQDNGYVEKDLIDPRNDKAFDSNLDIKITDTISGYSYSIDDTTGCENT